MAATHRCRLLVGKRMKGVRTIGLAAALGLVANPGLADRLQCSFGPGSAATYIASTIDLDIDGYGRAVIRDAIISKTGRTSVFGEVVSDTASRLSIRWDVRDVKGDPSEERYQDAHLVNRLTIQKATGSAVLTVLDAATRGLDYRAEGRCEQAK
ncbi:MAG: hypothetical protein MUE52_08140 [Tabrizicola sp.]|jgi:hypothetical protein|nr:hypothetical protein [Tabrizicola sp.]